ncbi:hypothetical protein EDC94DRAFT_626182 [Helicostylum pulchrum]|nr:hypothetical protein EDC94DRAFT_626182 [Helicostylum pulchrum]
MFIMKLDRENKRVHVMRNMSGVCSSCKKREYEDFSSFSFERALINSDFTDKQAQNLVPVNKIGDVYPLPPLLDFSCGVYGKSDSGVEKAKLIVGTRTINLLVTASVEISQDPTVHVGPGVEFGSNKGRSKFWLLPKVIVKVPQKTRKRESRRILSRSSSDLLNKIVWLKNFLAVYSYQIQ